MFPCVSCSGNLRLSIIVKCVNPSQKLQFDSILQYIVSSRGIPYIGHNNFIWVHYLQYLQQVSTIQIDLAFSSQCSRCATSRVWETRCCMCMYIHVCVQSSGACMLAIACARRRHLMRSHLDQGAAPRSLPVLSLLFVRARHGWPAMAPRPALASTGANRLWFTAGALLLAALSAAAAPGTVLVPTTEVVGSNYVITWVGNTQPGYYPASLPSPVPGFGDLRPRGTPPNATAGTVIWYTDFRYQGGPLSTLTCTTTYGTVFTSSQTRDFNMSGNVQNFTQSCAILPDLTLVITLTLAGVAGGGNADPHMQVRVVINRALNQN